MRRPLLTALALLLLAPVAADAATRHVVRGRGFGHGVGMSQYGAYGFAQQGSSYREILAHYYQGTQIRKTRTKRVRILLTGSRSSVRFRGATRLAGVRALDKRATYTVRPSRGRLGLFRAGRLKGLYRTLRVYRGGGWVRLLGRAINGIRNGRYRGALDLRPGAAGGVTVINRITLDAYVRGVVAGEMPSSWDAEALKAQAVAARTYALSMRKHEAVFDLYSDTRSQVYKGVATETRVTNAAVRATAQEVVTFAGAPIVTYYFSTSGGETENIENSFLGADPEPYLVGVSDPYDGISPHHSWRLSFSTRQMDARLGRYSPGTFRRVDVLKRGISPRIVLARVYGTAGSRTIDGPTLRARLGLYDTWARFSTVSTSQARYSAAWTSVFGRSSLPRSLRGVFTPAPRGRRLEVERRRGGRWKRVAVVRTARDGRYTANVRSRGLYRVRAGSVTGPAVRVS